MDNTQPFERFENGFEVFEIAHFDVHAQGSEIEVGLDEIEVIDIALIFGDQSGDRSEHPNFMRECQFDSREEKSALRDDIPAEVDPSFGLAFELSERRRADGIDDDATFGLQNPDDAITRHGEASWGEFYCGSVDGASDRDFHFDAGLISFAAEQPDEMPFAFFSGSCSGWTASRTSRAAIFPCPTAA